jgi:uncharacterized membrane protein (UPF0127 family)
MRCALLLALLTGAACSGPPRPAPDAVAPSSNRALREEGLAPAIRVDLQIEAKSGPVNVRAELAVTPDQRARGLMYRDALEEGTGMFFVGPERRVQSFWMKNTRIPLDMLFIDGPPDVPVGSVIGIVHQAEPSTLTPRSAGGPSRYVLEVPGGWARKHGVLVGAKVVWPTLPTPPSGRP